MSNLNDDFMREVLRRLRALETAPPHGYSSVSEGAFRIISPEGLIVVGSARVIGVLNGDGTINWTGPWNFSGLGSITGNVNIQGALDVLSRLTLGPSGYIEAGTVRIDRLGAYGGRIVSSGSVLYLDAVGSVIAGAPYFVANSASFTELDSLTVSANIKNFKIPHPTKQDHYLLHGATESPVSGVEYKGLVTLGENGEAVVELPEYFEALTKLEGRTVQLTPVGRPFQVGADLPVDGKFTAYGEPGREVSWHVMAERKGADFNLEEPVYGPIRE